MGYYFIGIVWIILNIGCLFFCFINLWIFLYWFVCRFGYWGLFCERVDLGWDWVCIKGVGENDNYSCKLLVIVRFELYCIWIVWMVKGFIWWLICGLFELWVVLVSGYDSMLFCVKFNWYLVRMIEMLIYWWNLWGL